MIPIIDIVGKLADKLIPDPAERHQFELELAKVNDQELQRQHDEMMGQMATNTEEAKNSNMFVAGWRPFIGWVGGIGLGYSFILEPVISWIARVLFAYKGDFPILDTGQLMALVTGMLGFGGMRMVEKIQGVPDSRPTSTSSRSTQPTAPTGIAPKKKGPLGLPWPF